MFEQRTHVMTGYFDLRAEWQRTGHQPRAIHSLDYPYKGLVLEIVDPQTKPGFHAWLREYFVPQRINDPGIAQCLWFAPLAWPGAGETSWFDYANSNAARVVLIWLLEEDPRESWQTTFGEHLGAIEHAGMASLVFIGGFVPAVPGTDRYLDEIR